MIVEKQGSRAEGGHVFRHFFDWNAKSRKKLLLETPIVSEQMKQKTSSNMHMPITQYHPVIENYTAGSLIGASSLVDEDDYGKSPGVVARLMGLSSLPTSCSETHSNRFPDTPSIPSIRNPPEFKQKDNLQMDRKHRVIEKFQTESLPPKSARSVSVTQQKLLSPIKNSGFVSSNDPTHIMEAASKIPLVGSPAVPSSGRKSSRRPVESNAARSLKGQSMNKSWDGCLERKPVSEDGKKSVSLAIQAKVNVKKREGLSFYGAEPINGQVSRQKNTLKKPSTNSILKQNNQKQNCSTDRGKYTAKSSASSVNSQPRKPVSEKNTLKKNNDRKKPSIEDAKNKICGKNDRSGNSVVKSNGLDVISFTFTSPMSHSKDKKNTFIGNTHGKKALINFVGSKDGLNLAAGGDSLSSLLDQKLRELTAMSAVSVSLESRINTTPIFQDKRNRYKASIDHNLIVQEHGAGFPKKPTTMEVDTESEAGYVKGILSDIGTMFEDFVLNRTGKIVNPRRFDQLEAKRRVFEKKHEVKLRRKLVFDCVSECVDLKCRVWPLGLAAVRRKDLLAEEVCNEISGWEQMKDCMVEELVDKDMSGSQHQKWLDYDLEAFEVGVDFEKQLLSSLIDELVDDILET
uniref:uncharacterized protein LOC122581945 n=1 Tax=Erigeron canadensis TaxID=72917 RepID=UPI001CB96AF3|nr:uncharacterized protein LOC122581945 [Erigeron canadensis]